jgi:hypothetical protein
MTWVLELAFSAQSPSLFFGFRINQCLIALVVIEGFSHRFHRQAEIPGRLFWCLSLSEHRCHEVPHMHVAAGDPEDFPPRVRSQLKVLICDFGCQTHTQRFNLHQVGEQVSEHLRK